jgi:hydroxymethylpyrimidine/phosphomethylpyrimidine kinase
MKCVLTIAGSDSGGGAGIQADLKTFAALGLFGTSAITAITAQNTVGVTAIHEVPLAVVVAQIDAVVADLRPEAVKVGMLAGAAIVEGVADALRRHRLPNVVVDPVMVAKSGDRLLRPEAVAALIRLLLPVADVLTPNLPEAAALLGRPVETLADQEAAALDIAALGPRAVVVKGGHSRGDPVDVLYAVGEVRHYGARRITTRSTHGTGCTFSSAIAGYLALGLPVAEAVGAAKRYLTGAIEHAPGLGSGHGPVHHAWEQHPPGVPHES